MVTADMVDGITVFISDNAIDFSEFSRFGFSDAVANARAYPSQKSQHVLTPDDEEGAPHEAEDLIFRL